MSRTRCTPPRQPPRKASFPGGGVALLRASKVLKRLQKDERLGDDVRIGVGIVGRAVEEPMRWIAQNAGQEGSIIVNKVKELEGEQGYNAAKDKYENLVNAGVIDPTKVVRYALQNASFHRGAHAHDRSSGRGAAREGRQEGRWRRAPRWHAGYGRHGRLLGYILSESPGRSGGPGFFRSR